MLDISVLTARVLKLNESLRVITTNYTSQAESSQTNHRRSTRCASRVPGGYIMSSVPPITPGTPMQPPKRFLPALVTASDRAAGNLVGGVNMDATPSQVQAFEDCEYC